MVAPSEVYVRVVLMSLLLVGVFAASSAAQTQVDSFARLPEVIKIGSVVYVEDDAGRRTKGRLLNLSGSSLILESGREHRRFDVDGLVKVTKVDSRRNGFWIGFAVGAVPGVFLGLAAKGYCYNESSAGGCPGLISSIVWPGGTAGAIGGWIGASIDGLIDHETLVFAKPQSSSTIRIAPLLSNGGSGLGLSFRF